MKPPKFNQCISALSYEFPAKQLISRYKYQQQWLYGNLFAQLLHHRLTSHYLDKQTPEVLLAVPLHPSKLRQRGFNQAFELARRLSALSHIPILKGCLKRTTNTAQQQGLSLKQRRSNIRNAFSLAKPVIHHHILLIDDVVTSGSTCNEISKLLLKHGANQVDVCCLARTPDNTIFR